jgi:hypothetical protein
MSEPDAAPKGQALSLFDRIEMHDGEVLVGCLGVRRGAQAARGWFCWRGGFPRD